jgi:type VI secretion system protein ImpK
MSDLDRTIIKPRPGQPPTGNDKTIIKPRPAGVMANSDKTIISPRKKPGMASLASKETITSSQATNSLAYDFPSMPLLVQQASPLLSVISQIKQLDGSFTVEELRHHISNLITVFTLKASKSQDNSSNVKKASYALCATIDESILNTPWGGNSAWSQQPLLSLFHKETYGGEKFYAMLDHEVSSEIKNYELIELLYMCLSLGFLGKLRVDQGGLIKAEKIRANTYSILTKNRDRFTRQLSTTISPFKAKKSRLTSFLPIWLLGLVLTLSGFLAYNYWLLELNKASDTVAAQLASLIPIEQEETLPEGKIRKEVVLLRQLLQQEIEQKVLTVNDYHNRSSIVLNSNELFPSGSAEVNTAFEPILDKIAKALETLPGRIIVSGHTDSSAIRTARFPSNWHLSLARASAVGKYMSGSADLKARLLPEGRGESEPLTENDTADGRAKNRRVAIELFYNERKIN